MPAPAHRIRLRDFWDAAPLPDGRTRFRRSFGRPRLPAGERAWLVGDAVAGPTTVVVNGEPLGPVAVGPFAFDVTDRLQPQNEVVIETTANELGEVALEMRVG